MKRDGDLEAISQLECGKKTISSGAKAQVSLDRNVGAKALIPVRPFLVAEFLIDDIEQGLALLIARKLFEEKLDGVIEPVRGVIGGVR